MNDAQIRTTVWRVTREHHARVRSIERWHRARMIILAAAAMAFMFAPAFFMGCAARTHCTDVGNVAVGIDREQQAGWLPKKILMLCDDNILRYRDRRDGER